MPDDVVRTLKSCYRIEKSSVAKLQLKLALDNIGLAKKSNVPICQDTGIFTFFIKMGRKLDFDVVDAVNRAVEQATREVPLRVNAVDPITRKPFKTNTGPSQPAIHFETSKKQEIEINLLVKGAGSENYSRLFMFKPTAGESALHQAVVLTLSEAGGKACPPVIVGVGVGGNAEVAVSLAKKALLRSLDSKNRDPAMARLERGLEDTANKLGIGPMGLGGKCTALRVFVEKAACHTASLPVAVALQCWPARKARAKLVSGKLKVVEP